MLVKLIDLFSFLSVVLRAGTLVFQSVLLGGVLFVLWIARRSPDASDEGIDRVQASSWKLLRLSATGLAIVQLYGVFSDEDYAWLRESYLRVAYMLTGLIKR